MARTVLVVDDEPAVLEVVASMLEDLGCKVVTAVNAADALELLAERTNKLRSCLLTSICRAWADTNLVTKPDASALTYR